MKNLKHRLLLLISTLVLISCSDAEPTVPEPNAPDDNIVEVDPSKERETLVQLYKDTNGDNWTNNENWNSDKPIEEWVGVVINKDTETVESLSLPNNNLSGVANISGFQLLKSVDLSNNSLSAVNLQNQSSITSLDISENNIAIVMHSDDLPSNFVCEEWGEQDSDLYAEPKHKNGYQYPQYSKSIGTNVIWDSTLTEPEYIDEANKIIHISSPSELAWLAEENDKYNSRFDQFKGWTIYQKSSLNLVDQPWKPIGVKEPFKGVYDGENHLIYGLHIISSEYNYAGLFGYCWDATIKNVNLIGFIDNLKSGGCAGGICGHARDIRINDCISACVVAGEIAGGVLGYGIGGEIYSCSNLGIITSEAISGGIVGLLKYQTFNVELCANTSSVTSFSPSGSAACGGIIGKALDGARDVTITLCTNLCEVGVRSEKNGVAGGIIGQSDDEVDEILNCLNYGNVLADSDEAYSYAGGISGIGSMDIISSVNKAQIVKAISTAEKNGSATAGGISAKNSNIIKGCTNGGAIVSATSLNGYTDNETGEFISKSYAGEINGTSDTYGLNTSTATLIGTYQYIERSI